MNKMFPAHLRSTESKIWKLGEKLSDLTQCLIMMVIDIKVGSYKEHAGNHHQENSSLGNRSENLSLWCRRLGRDAHQYLDSLSTYRKCVNCGHIGNHIRAWCSKSEAGQKGNKNSQTLTAYLQDETDGSGPGSIPT